MELSSLGIIEPLSVVYIYIGTFTSSCCSSGWILWTCNGWICSRTGLGTRERGCSMYQGANWEGMVGLADNGSCKETSHAWGVSKFPHVLREGGAVDVALIFMKRSRILLLLKISAKIVHMMHVILIIIEWLVKRTLECWHTLYICITLEHWVSSTVI